MNAARCRVFCVYLVFALSTGVATQAQIPIIKTSDSRLVLKLPVGGTELVDWAISQYVDVDPTSGTRDYMGGDKVSNDGHNGVDFALPNFRWMDRDIPVLAAADGRVVRIQDGNYDRNHSCQGRSNRVEIEHFNGMLSKYLHLKKDSVVVSVGQEVKAGHRLGSIGSSGCSKGPHLHFELLDDTGEVLDPFLEGLWESPPRYDIPITLLDYNVLNRKMVMRDVKDPPPNSISIPPGEGKVGVGLAIMGMVDGDEIRFVLRNGSDVVERTRVADQEFYYFTYHGRNFTVNKKSGTWRIRVYINDRMVVDHRLSVRYR